MYRGMVVFQGATNLPEDRFVNTFHFKGSVVEDPIETVGALLGPLVEDFYNDAPGNPVGAFLSPFILREAQVRFYNLNLPEPREPYVHNFTLPAAGSATTLPEEVAVVLSLHGQPPLTPRKRGRIYLGPLNRMSAIFTEASVTEPTRVAAGFRDSLRDASLALGTAVRAIGAGWDWAIRSVTPEENAVVIWGGFIDNAFDTQRRRGPVASGRTNFVL